MQLGLSLSKRIPFIWQFCLHAKHMLVFTTQPNPLILIFGLSYLAEFCFVVWPQTSFDTSAFQCHGLSFAGDEVVRVVTAAGPNFKNCCVSIALAVGSHLLIPGPDNRSDKQDFAFTMVPCGWKTMLHNWSNMYSQWVTFRPRYGCTTLRQQTLLQWPLSLRAMGLWPWFCACGAMFQWSTRRVLEHRRVMLYSIVSLKVVHMTFLIIC